MRSISLFLVFIVFTTASTFAQSHSYQTLKDKFNDVPAMHSFTFNGWMSRLVLNLAGEYEFREAIKDMKYMRIMTIPRSEFSAKHVSVKGFKKVLQRDSFEELALIREEGEEVSIYLREGNNHRNTYFVLVEKADEVVAIELKGYIDPKLLNPENTTLAINN